MKIFNLYLNPKEKIGNYVKKVMEVLKGILNLIKIYENNFILFIFKSYFKKTKIYLNLNLFY